MNGTYMTEDEMDWPTYQENLLMRRLRKAVRGFRELSAVLRVLENTCPYCWDGGKDCACREESDE
jgi:alkylhydroperoxidase family enzyme